jgi:hypothetical protein
MSDKMMIIDPHVHMSARTTDDYEAMAAAGVVANAFFFVTDRSL